MIELSRETGINDVEKTESYVRELVSEKLLKEANLKNDMTTVKLTFRGSQMVESFMPHFPKWTLKFNLWAGAAMLVVGVAFLVTLVVMKGSLVLVVLNGISTLGLGAMFLLVWLYQIRGRREMLRMENDVKMSV